MTKLIEILESADVGSREIDCRIYVAVYKPGRDWRDGDIQQDAPHLSTSMDAALSFTPDGCHFDNLHHHRHPDMGGRDWSATLRAHKMFRSGGQRTAPLAICVAILKARETIDD